MGVKRKDNNLKKAHFPHNFYKVVKTTSSQVITMDVPRKIPQEDIILLNEFQTQLQRRGIKTNQKKLIDASIRFALAHQKKFIYSLQPRKDNTKEKTQQLLNSTKRIDLGKEWLNEIDTLA